MVTGLKRGTPAYEAGFDVGDEIVAVGEERILPEQWSRRQEQYRPNERASVLVARRGKLLRVEATFGAEPRPSWRLEPDPAATPAQVTARRAWLGE